MATKTIVKPETIHSGAHFSDDRSERYALYREWDKSKPYLLFIGLNPSTADEYIDDPTIRRMQGFALEWGYGGFYVVNLYTQITDNPKELKFKPAFADYEDAMDALGWAKHYFKDYGCVDVCYAWGANQKAANRAHLFYNYFNQFRPFCLGKNTDGSPKHPLYLSKSTKRIPWIGSTSPKKRG